MIEAPEIHAKASYSLNREQVLFLIKIKQWNFCYSYGIIFPSLTIICPLTHEIPKIGKSTPLKKSRGGGMEHSSTDWGRQSSDMQSQCSGKCNFPFVILGSNTYSQDHHSTVPVLTASHTNFCCCCPVISFSPQTAQSYLTYSNTIGISRQEKFRDELPLPTSILQPWNPTMARLSNTDQSRPCFNF